MVYVTPLHQKIHFATKSAWFNNWRSVVDRHSLFQKYKALSVLTYCYITTSGNCINTWKKLYAPRGKSFVKFNVCFITYKDSFTAVISFVYYSWILNEFLKVKILVKKHSAYNCFHVLMLLILFLTNLILSRHLLIKNRNSSQMQKNTENTL